MIQIGLHNTLIVKRFTDNGAYLEDEDENEVLLPNKYVDEFLKEGDEIEVFVYKDSEDRPVATTLEPLIHLHEYTMLNIKSVNSIGAFADWGLEKDLLIPYSEQRRDLKEGDLVMVFLYLDDQTDRLVGTTKITNTLLTDEVELKPGDEVNTLIYDESELGFSAIVNDMYHGFYYNNETFQDLYIGDKITGYVRKVRTDGKVDLRLNKFGYRGVDENIKKLHQALIDHGGRLEISDKSSPEEIYDLLGMSKKVFKKALGALYKQRKVTISPNEISFKADDGKKRDNKSSDRKPRK